ncbi:MAG TPA: GYD domain-containing protein [Methyloceanibacter sp.]|nr:GYD domain-containing protein [Methyloceanibacter sp.]
MRNIKDTIGRADAFEVMAEKSGATIKVLCWTIGRYHVVAVFEAADDESATRARVQCLLARQCPVGDPARLLVRGNERNLGEDGVKVTIPPCARDSAQRANAA